VHELAITQSMFDIVLQHAQEAGARKVGKINLVIGELTGIVGECVQFYLEFLSKGTVVEGAVLDIETVPAKAACGSCGETFELKGSDWACPSCGGKSLEAVAGRELFVESIEVD